jgi:hypothetical protein
MLTKRQHHETGEVCHVLRDYDPPPRFPAREKHGVHGRPHLTLWVFADRVELELGWCYSSGHMEVYEEQTDATFRREGEDWPASLGPAVADWFGERVAVRVFALLSDPGAFAEEGD